jgi:hypothetical protein
MVNQAGDFFSLSGEVVNVKEFGAVGDGVTDDTAAIQAAINAAQAVGDAMSATVLYTFSGTYPPVFFPPGIYIVTDTIIWKSAPLLGVFPRASNYIIWAGVAGGTCVQRPDPTIFAHGDANALIHGIAFGADTAALAPSIPGTWIDVITAAGGSNVNDLFILDHCAFNEHSGDGIVLHGMPLKVSWSHLRFDNYSGGHEIVLNADDNAFSLQPRFELAHSHIGTGGGDAPLHVLSSGGPTCKIALRDVRWEVGPPTLSGTKTMILVDAFAGDQTVDLDIDGVSITGNVSLAAYDLLHVQTAAANSMTPRANIRALNGSLGAIVGGTPLRTGYPTLTGQPNWDWLVLNASGAWGVSATDSQFQYRRALSGGPDGFDVFLSDEANPRFSIDSNGKLQWGPGGASAVDTSLERFGAGTHSYVNHHQTGFASMQEIADPGGIANRGRLYTRDNGAGKTQLCVVFGTGAVQVIATEP